MLKNANPNAQEGSVMPKAKGCSGKILVAVFATAVVCGPAGYYLHGLLSSAPKNSGEDHTLSQKRADANARRQEIQDRYTPLAIHFSEESARFCQKHAPDGSNVYRDTLLAIQTGLFGNAGPGGLLDQGVDQYLDNLETLKKRGVLVIGNVANDLGFQSTAGSLYKKDPKAVMLDTYPDPRKESVRASVAAAVTYLVPEQNPGNEVGVVLINPETTDHTVAWLTPEQISKQTQFGYPVVPVDPCQPLGKGPYSLEVK